jgi:hypothetical protein
MSYGIYDKKTHLLLERNLPQDTTFAMIDELMLDYPEDWTRFAIVKEIDQGWVCTMTMRLVPVYPWGHTQNCRCAMVPLHQIPAPPHSSFFY